MEIDFDNACRVKNNIVVNVRCNNCGYIRCAFSAHTLANKGYICKGCTICNYKILCNSINRTYLEHSCHAKRQGVVRSSCNICRTTSETYTGNLVKCRAIACETCLVNKYRERAAQTGFEYLYREVVNKQSVVVLKCNEGHTFKTGGLFKGFSCKECQVLRYKNVLAEKNCKLLKLERRDGEDSRVFYANSAGDLFDTTADKVQSGVFATTLENQWRDCHSTYLIHLIYNNISYCKIGTAQLPHRRLQKLRLLGESKVYNLATFDTRFGADKLESELHREFKSFKLSREIADTFTLMTRKVKRVGSDERAIIKEGATEWFTGEVLAVLKSKYKLE